MSWMVASIPTQRYPSSGVNRAGNRPNEGQNPKEPAKCKARTGVTGAVTAIGHHACM